MTAARQAFGRLGEQIAARWLRRHGWDILAHRFRVGHRDMDLIVQRGQDVAFVEVKARHGLTFGSPLEAVHWRKQRELSRVASIWVDRFGRPGWSYQFDVIGVLISGSHVRICRVENAFRYMEHVG